MTRSDKIVIDLSDLHLLRKHRFYVRNHKRPYVYTSIYRKTVYLHRLILGAVPGQDVDHINGNPLDNRKINLRLCSRSQNLAAKTKHHNKAELRGVHYQQKGYAAHIHAAGFKIHIGRYQDKYQAARAYDINAKEWYGDFAVLNDV